MTLEPPGGYALAEVPVNVYAHHTSAVDLPTELLGTPILVRATPTGWTWDFGDGTTLGPTATPGTAYPTLTHTHTYSRPGPYAITMWTHYSAQYSIAGGPLQPIPGTARVASPPATVQVLAGRTELHAG